MKQPEIRINSPEAEINFNSIKNLDNYSEIIPQKIEKENINYLISTEEENLIDPNLEFSFGKDMKKQTETNRLKTDYFDKKEKDILSENLSNYQLTDSVSNFIENEENNKKMQLIKEKFISNFKSKDRNESLERAFTLFEKFHNNLNNKTNITNLSFSHKLEKPFKFLMSQSTNSLSIIDKHKKETEDNNITSDRRDIKHSLNTIKSNEDFFKYKIRKISKIIKERDDMDNKTNNKTNCDETNYEKKSKDKKIFSLKDDKKKGIFIRKVIREEKYFIDDDGTEKLIGIKQSTFDSKNNKKKIKKINVNKIKNSKNNNTLFNKKKFAEYIKDKINNKNNNKSSCFQNKNISNDNNIKNIEINTEFINNKNINNDNCNNIKIVINKINKINSNPKINLNFIKKYRNGIKNNNQPDENKENRPINGIKINNSKNRDIPEEKNKICHTEINPDNKIHIIKVGKSLNQSKIKSDILNNYNISNQLGKYSHKIKKNLPPMGKLRFVKCEKINNKNKIPFTIIKKFNTNRPIPRKRDLTKRNYSFKEIRNLSKNSESNKYIFTKHLERHELEKNKNIKNIKVESYQDNNKANDNLKFQKYLIDTFNKKNKFNHNFYESKSFSLQNKNDNQNFKSQNNLLIDCHTPNSNRILFYKHAFNNNDKNTTKNINNSLSIINTNNNNYMINTSFNNIFRYNNTLN